MPAAILLFCMDEVDIQKNTGPGESLGNATEALTESTWTRGCLPSHSQRPAFSQVTLPVYLNFTRADLIFTVDFEIATKEDPRSFYERGVAVLCTE